MHILNVLLDNYKLKISDLFELTIKICVILILNKKSLVDPSFKLYLLLLFFLDNKKTYHEKFNYTFIVFICFIIS